MRWVNEVRMGELLAQVTDISYSDFYIKKYDTAPVDEEHFFELSMLTRGELGATPLRERVFCPPEDIRFAAFTSGTSSKEPLIIPFAKVPRYYFEPSLGTGVRRPLVIHPPMMKAFGMTFVQQCDEAEHQLSPIFGDVQNMQNSALLASALDCDAIYSIPTVAGLFAAEAAKRGVREQIKLIALSSETLTSARRAELKEAFPRALIANLYGSTELGQLPFFTCKRMMEREEGHFHILTDALAAVEIVDGELVVSYGLNRAMPLVRYRTGDFFEEVPEGCVCGLPGPVVRWSHRTDVDRVRLNGMEFDVEAADRAFSAFPHLKALPYQVHFYATKGSPAIAMTVELVVPDHTHAADIARFAEAELPDAWRISATATIRTAMDRGFVSSFEVRPVQTLSVTGLKAKRFVNHVG